MAIKIESMTGTGLIGNSKIHQKVDITADTEGEITALPAYGQPVTDVDGMTVIPAKNSMAHVAGYKAIYELSPSGIWTKM
jgi:hypothetical protein